MTYCIYNTLECFWGTSKYNKIGFLLCMSLDKVARVKQELSDLISQLKCHKDDLKIYLDALREILSPHPTSV